MGEGRGEGGREEGGVRGFKLSRCQGLRFSFFFGFFRVDKERRHKLKQRVRFLNSSTANVSKTNVTLKSGQH